jgi:hypothetical protein
MKNSFKRVIKVNELSEALRYQYGEDFSREYNYDLATFLFGGTYMGHYFKELKIVEEDFEGSIWQDEQKVRVKNAVCGFLRDICPNDESILVEIGG